MFGVVIDKTSRRLIAFFYWPLTCFDMIGDVMSLELYIKVPSLIYPIVYIVSHLPRGENASMVKQKEIFYLLEIQTDIFIGGIIGSYFKITWGGEERGQRYCKTGHKLRVD